MEGSIFTGYWGNYHIQGIAVDKKGGYIYYSFTTKLVKATLDGKIIGSVDGIVGHLGCIAFNEEDGCVYGSLEYKNDAIGKGILSGLDTDLNYDDSFYAVRFDAARIDRLGIIAENNDIMTALYLKEVVSDYNGVGINKKGETVPHKHGCSGIDGLTFGPIPGGGGYYMFVAYGIYGDTERQDNDHQVILCYDVKDWNKYAKPINQKSMHHSGPENPDHKFFFYTGNTEYGVQNLEYDSFTNSFFLAVYCGGKPEFPNYSMFAIDASVSPVLKSIEGSDTPVETLAMKKMGEHDEKTGLYGWFFPYGTTGMYSYGDGRWLFSHNGKSENGQYSYITPYEWDEKHPFICSGEEK